MEFSPIFCSVTYHREDVKYVEKENGLLERHTVRRRPGTVGISAAIMQRYGLTVIPHLICGGQSRYDIEDALIDLDFLGIQNVLALRGDNLKGEHTFRNHPDGHLHASELVEQIERMNRGVFIDGEVEQCHNTNFCIWRGRLPRETRRKAPNKSRRPAPAERESRRRRRVHHHADEFRQRENPVVHRRLPRGRNRRADRSGIKPFSTKAQLTMLPQIFHVDLPEALVETVKRCNNNAEVREAGVEWAIAQGRELIAAGIPVLHFYTMGKTDNMVKIARALF